MDFREPDRLEVVTLGRIEVLESPGEDTQEVVRRVELERVTDALGRLESLHRQRPSTIAVAHAPRERRRCAHGAGAILRRHDAAPLQDPVEDRPALRKRPADPPIAPDTGR